ncbi:MAG: hypothetical protein ACFB10_17800 [Salibacteraceae bacterium]
MENTKPSALIVFPDEWIAYSPTILNFYKCLSKTHRVRIVCFELDVFDNPVEFEDITCIKIRKFRYLLLRRLKRYRWYKGLLLNRYLEREKETPYDMVIGVDALGFTACRAYFERVIFLSLEVANDELMLQARRAGIRQLIIQSKERKEFLIGPNSATKVHYIQNAPILDRVPKGKKEFNHRLVYFGNIKPYYGIDQCIESLRYLPLSYSLTLKGIKDENYTAQLEDAYQDLIESHRLLFDHTYTDQDEVLDYLSFFDIGFCMFDFRFGHGDNFNYLSSPSGKMFNYFAAGLPVIGNDIVGFKPISDYKAGKLIDEIIPSKIAEAVETIKSAYSDYSARSARAGDDFDFQKGFDKFIVYQDE